MDVAANPSLAVSLADIEAAAARIKPEAVRTPLLRSPALDALTGGRIFLKPEVLQRTGSFKFRGAFNALAGLPESKRKAGVVAWSSGNHAQGVAEAARILGMPAVIVMPADAPKAKIDATRGYGAEVVTYDRWTENREEIGRRIAAERGAEIIPPYDDARIIAGQGTAGLEIAQDLAAMGEKLDATIACCSGGGLVAGVATAIKAKFPDAKVYSAEPAGFDDLARSLAKGEKVANEPGKTSICDALLAPTPGDITFPIHQARLAGGLVVTDEEVLAAMAYAFRTLKLVVEPGGAVGLAAVLAGKLPTKGQTIAVVLSGGNVDAAMMARALA